MKKEYMTFTPDIKDLIEDKEVKLTVKDLTPGPRKYGAHIVKAMLSADPKRHPDWDVLRVFSWTGVPYPEPWAIEITKELDETEAGLPHSETITARK